MSLSTTAVERMAEEWDDHVRSCQICLHEGERLCYEGEYLTERVVVSRAALRAEAAQSERHVDLLAPRSQLLPGVPA